MGLLVFVTGDSGLGKSRSVKSMNPEKTFIIKVRNKPLPFPEKKNGFKKIGDDGSGNMMLTSDYETIKMILGKAYSKGFRSVVIDDANYLMTTEFMATMDEKGFDKFNSLAGNVWDLANICVEAEDDLIVYWMWHTEMNADGSLKMKTIGKLVDEKINLPGLSTVVLRADRVDGKYVFRTQHSNDVSKSPEEMFPTEIIPNDLSAVDKYIREYYAE